MATFLEHIHQAKQNIQFLSDVNARINSQWDWQVTVSFYVAVHLVNAHIVQKSDNHYRSHEQVNNVLNPYNILSVSKLPEAIYLAYVKLQNLSRRARYLCSDNPDERTASAFHTSEKYFAKAVRELDKVISYFDQLYNLALAKIDLNCLRLKEDNLNFFTYKSSLEQRCEYPVPQ
ncbi:hypothetical protein LX64_00105 [Chitinophaga skermanii]|uniref:HEPN domain-containing protein n=1 Tax=Chitinophaga skermanii TaxID=331697 RepID=A0A327R3G6_9BACT|nr:hypothetical protein [Chitinophaga skermanii]RAJ10502.1 hypothetical protein LX64_00105 [Chitinophaga skermanii]